MCLLAKYSTFSQCTISSSDNCYSSIPPAPPRLPPCSDGHMQGGHFHSSHQKPESLVWDTWVKRSEPKAVCFHSPEGSDKAKCKSWPCQVHLPGAGVDSQCCSIMQSEVTADLLSHPVLPPYLALNILFPPRNLLCLRSVLDWAPQSLCISQVLCSALQICGQWNDGLLTGV